MQTPGQNGKTVIILNRDGCAMLAAPTMTHIKNFANILNAHKTNTLEHQCIGAL